MLKKQTPNTLPFLAALFITCASLATASPFGLALAEDLEEPVKEEPIPIKANPDDLGRRMPTRMPVKFPSITDTLRDDAGLIMVNALHPVVIGTLIEAESGHPGRPADYCLEDGKLWTGAAFRVGGLPVFGLSRTKTLSDSAGDTFLIMADLKPSIDDKLTDAGPCPPSHGEPWSKMQWRDDWTAPEGQHLLFRDDSAVETRPWSHARLKSLPYYEASTAEPLRVIHVEVISSKVPSKSTKKSTKTPTKTVVITVHNVFNAPLTLPLSLHYEGGGGKPSPRHVEVKLSIPPGEQHTVTADLSIFEGDPATKAGRKGEFTLQSVDLKGSLGSLSGVTLYIEQPVR